MQLEEMVHSAEHPLSAIKDMLSRGNLSDLLLYGPPGTGKTTTAHAIAKEIGADIHEFNASDERGIDFIRTRVKEVATQRGWGEHTIILLDEADGLTRQAQDALRRIIETGHALFILTANEHANIISALKSRCLAFKFRPYNAEEVEMFLPVWAKSLAVETCSAYNGDLRKIALALEAVNKDFDGLKEMVGAEAQAYSDPALSIIGGDWEGLRKELQALDSNSNISILNRLHQKVRQLDMEPSRFHHYSRIWGDAVLAAHQWPLSQEGFIDWFVGSLASLWDGKEE
jgi:DNA polymerase III delta prime subunit